MLISLKLTNFRRHASLEIEFDPKFNLISGRNNAGKTSVFYAIEYVQFGAVPGFKKLAQLARYGQKSMAVELVFQGKDDRIYKLARFHSFTAKAAKGTFELFESSDPQTKDPSKATWKTVLSSQNKDKETDLSLKLNELLGTSRRFFETGIHFYQGRIPEILAGSPKLDIVFGITAANALIDAFKTKASVYESKQMEIESIRQQIQLLQKEKESQEQFQATTEAELHECEAALKRSQEKAGMIDRFNDLQQDILQKYDPFEVASNIYQESKMKHAAVLEELKEFEQRHAIPRVTEECKEATARVVDLEETMQGKEKELDKLTERLVQAERDRADFMTKNAQAEAIAREIRKVTAEWGGEEQLEAEISRMEAELASSSKRLDAIESEQHQLQEKTRDIDRELGDGAGILARRVSTKGKPQCEYCGALIDPSSLESEIAHLEKHQAELQDAQGRIEEDLGALEKEARALHSKERDTTNVLAKKRSAASQLASLYKQQKQQGESTGIVAELAKLDKQIRESEQRKRSIKQEVVEFKQELREKQDLVAEHRKVLDQIAILQKNQVKWERNAENGRNQVDEEARSMQVQLQPLIKQLDVFIHENPGFHPDLPALVSALREPRGPSRSESPAKKGKKAVVPPKEATAPTSEDLVPASIQEIKTRMNDISIAVDSESGARVDLLSKQLQEKTQQHASTNQAIDQVGKQIAELEQSAAKSAEEIKLGERYFRYQEIFQKIQSQIRQNISKALEQKILHYHQLLSSDDEFKKVHVDPEDYSLSVLPYDSGSEEFYPALVYQGGGHKLLLGLAYKFALSELIGTPPYLLIDEPTEFMDQKNRGNLLTNLSKMSHAAQIILITHQDVDKIHCNHKIDLKKE